MAVEAELKARITNPETVRTWLQQRAHERTQTYRDRYFDCPGGTLDRQGYEVRLRTVDTGSSSTTLFTFKEPAVHVSGSKPEHETTLGDGDPVAALVHALGLVERITFAKHCRNYDLTEHGRELLATLVHVPELAESFLEVETLVADTSKVSAGIDAVQAVLDALGVREEQLTTESYTDAVAATRRP